MAGYAHALIAAWALVAMGTGAANVASHSGGPVPLTTTILWTSPADGETDVALDAPIVVAFSEIGDTASITWSITPAVPGTVILTWDMNAVVLTMNHSLPFEACTLYTVEVSGSDIVPGAVPNPWSFTTMCPPPVVSHHLFAIHR